MCVDVSEIDGRTTAWSPNNSIGGRCCRPFSAASAAAANEKLRGPHHRHGQIWRFTKRIPVIADGPFPPTHISANNSLWCLHFSLVRPFCCVCLAGTRQICRLVFILEKNFHVTQVVPLMAVSLFGLCSPWRPSIHQRFDLQCWPVPVQRKKRPRYKWNWIEMFSKCFR